MTADSKATNEGGGPGECRLDSWKEIAAYLRRHVTTVRRWEKHEGLPVHRHLHNKLGSVYAFPFELDSWRRDRRVPLERSETDEWQDGRAERAAITAVRERLSTQSTVALGIVGGAVVVCSVIVIALVLVWGLPTAAGGVGRGVARSVNPAAHQEYLVGRYHLWRDSEDNLRQAITHFERATEIDRDYAAAYASLAHAWWKRGLWSRTLAATEGPARVAADRAMQLDETLPEAYVVQADLERLYGGDLARAEGLILRALELDPNHVDAHYSYGLLLMTLGRFSEAIAHMGTAAEFEPLSPAIQSDFGRVLYRARRYEEAIERLNRALELEPAMGWLVYSRLADAYEKQGQYDRAGAALRRAGSDYGYPSAKAELARVLARKGDRDAARQILKDVQQATDRVSLNTIAAAYAALGDRDAAFQLLFEAIEQRAPGPNFVAVDPLFDELHADPRWEHLLRRIRHRVPVDADWRG